MKAMIAGANLVRHALVQIMLYAAVLMALASPANAAEFLLMGEPAPTGKHFKLGKEVYRANCAGCHDAGLNRAPQKVVLRNLRPDAIYKSLTSGVMRAMASGLDDEQKRAVSVFLAEREFAGADSKPEINACAPANASFDRSAPPALPGWGLGPDNAHFIPSDTAGIGKKDVHRLKLKWAFGFAHSMRIRSQPSLAAGAIFIGSQNGYVRALDRKTGCERWRYEAESEVRTSVLIEDWAKGDTVADPLAFFGDQTGGVYAVRAFTGEVVWKKKVEEHSAAVITAAPALHDGLLYVPVSSLEESAAADPNYPCCSFRGSVVALDAKTGEEKWRTYMVGKPQQIEREDGRVAFGPSGIAVWNSPSIDSERGLMFVATGDNYSEPATHLSDAVVALHLKTGAIVWSYQATKGDVWNVACYIGAENCPEDEGPDFDFGAGTILARTTSGQDLVLAGQKSGIAYALKPDTGELVWQKRVGRGGIAGGILFGIAASQTKLYVPVSDFGPMEESDYPASPGLYAINIEDGALAWEAKAPNVCPADLVSCIPGNSGAITATPDLVFAGADDGHFRVHDADTGKVLLDLDMKRPFETVNGVSATGGAMSGGAAPIVSDGQMIVASGYGTAMKIPGNVLLVYEAE